MTAMTLLPQSRPLTSVDLDSIREQADDGHRYELIDGTLIVSPAPVPRHQVMAAALFRRIDAGRPPDVLVLFAPVDVRLDDDTVLQPDLLVARTSDFGERNLPVAPMLAVEVLSPSTRLLDLNLKRARYEAAGCASYWVADPSVPSVTVWQLREGEYVEVAHLSGDETATISEPFEVTLQPSTLLD